MNAIRAPLAGRLLDPLIEAAAGLRPRGVRQAQLAGIHNPFGRAVALCDPWKFLDVCESGEILDCVAALIGQDIVLWDSELYLDEASWSAAFAREGRWWPADPLAGALVDIALATGDAAVCEVHARGALLTRSPGAHYVIRYMPATSLYNRDPLFPANRVAMEERPLVNYMTRPLWLVRGEDRAGSDFATGFQAQAPGWAAETISIRTEV